MSPTETQTPPARPSFVTVATPGSAPESAARRRPIAVLVTHGMGQQVRFETVDGVIAALRRAADPRKTDPVDATVRIANLGGTPVPRVEVTIGGREAHFYEAYWAPITEGKVSLWDVFSFLLGAGVNGLRLAWGRRDFERMMFGGWRSLRIDRVATVVRLALAVLAVLTLLVLNSVALVALAGRVNLGPLAGADALRHAHVIRDIALFGFGFFQVVAGIAFGMLDDQRRRDLPGLPWTSRVGGFLALTGVLWIVGAGVSAAVDLARRSALAHPFAWVRGQGPFPVPGVGAVVTAVAVSALAAIAIPALSRRTRRAPELGILLIALVEVAGLGTFAISWVQGFRHEPFPRPLAPVAAFVLAECCALAVAAIPLLRWFLIEYVGDVAAYVSSHTVSKFDKVRTRIQTITFDLARAIYREPGNEGFLYPEVAIVGHSLGSVIAYDTLDAMINEDRVTGAGLRVAERTRLLLTVSSPLEKTAFLFRSQRASPADVREGLAEAKQPLIQSYRLRPERWINLYSRLDWIGGPLTFYDAAPGAGADPEERRLYATRRVRNLEDRAATTPLVAHNEVFSGRLFGKTLYRKVFS